MLLAVGTMASFLLLDMLIRQVWTPDEPGQTPASWYGAWVLTPAVVTIILAMILRQVVPALSIGILLAACMMAPFQAAEAGFGTGVLGGVQLSVEYYLINAIADHDHVKVIVFSLVISGMVGVISANGGAAAVVSSFTRWSSTRQRGQVSTWVAGLLVFFDDYANAMIVGPSMRPVCDRLRISRAKLAYIVDSTAAPVASIALIGTWIGTEVAYIDDGLKQIRDMANVPEFMRSASAYQIFLSTIPYRFYPILALVMVFLVGWLGRDFGPMRRAERNAQREPAPRDEQAAPGAGGGRAWYAIVPVLALVIVTLSLLMLSGYYAVDWDNFAPPGDTSYSFAALQAIVSNANAYNSILYAALVGLTLAILISLGSRAQTLAETFESTLSSMSRLLSTIVVLVLAWTLSSTMKNLQLGTVAVELMRGGGFDDPLLLRFLPLGVFLTSCVVSFATGTSYGTMGILCPAVVTISAGLLGGMPESAAIPIFYAAVGAVLAGAVFGDHCSPISDTTVLSSLASECSLEQHVWTQIPYALTVAGVAILTGDLLCRLTPVPIWAGLLLGVVALFGILRLFGRRPDAGAKTAA